MEKANMKDFSNSSFNYESVINLVEINNYKGAIDEIENHINSSNDYDDLAFSYLNCGFINTKLRDYSSAVNDFSRAIFYEDKFDILIGRSKDIALNGRSNARYKCNNFKGAIDDKRKAKKIRLLEELKYIEHQPNFLCYKNILLGSFDQFELDSKYSLLTKISSIEKPKYDLIEDYKKVINDKRKQEVINSLEKISDSKYKIADYKGSIKAIRRSEKYYS